MHLPVLGVQEYGATLSAGVINRVAACYQGRGRIQHMPDTRRVDEFKRPFFTLRHDSSYSFIARELHFELDAERIAQPFVGSAKLFAERVDKLHPQMSIVGHVKPLGKPDTVIFIGEN
jgi:hypothetical protein